MNLSKKQPFNMGSRSEPEWGFAFVPDEAHERMATMMHEVQYTIPESLHKLMRPHGWATAEEAMKALRAAYALWTTP